MVGQMEVTFQASQHLYPVALGPLEPSIFLLSSLLGDRAWRRL